MSTAFMQLQSTARNKVVSPFSNIFFDQTIALSDDADFTYDSVQSTIQINKAGSYYLDWFLVTAASQYPVTMLFQATTGVSIPANTSLKSDQATGSAVLNVEQPGVVIALCIGKGSVQLADVPIVANLLIHSMDIGSVTTPTTGCGGSIVNFQSGVVDCLNPLSWPILLEVLQISWMSDCFMDLCDVCTPCGLEKLLNLPENVLSNASVNTQISNALTPVLNALASITENFKHFTQVTANAGLFSTDVYLTHADMSLVPAIATGDLPFFSLDGGPITPQIIAQDGVITAFAAEYDCVVAFDFSLFNTLQGIITTLNQLFDVFAGTIAVLISTLGSIGPMLTGLGAHLPSDYADTINKLIMAHLKAGTPDSNHHVHAILWKRTDDRENLCVDWQKVSDLDLGAVPWAELAPVDTFVAGIGDIIAAVGNIVSSLLSLLSGRGTPNDAPTNVPFRAAIEKDLNHPILAGDYLMVQFTLVGSDNTTVLAGVIATNLMASVAIDCV